MAARLACADRGGIGHRCSLHVRCLGLRRAAGGQFALCDLAADPAESTDVAARFPDIAASMQTMVCEQWAALLATGRAFATAGPVDSSRGRKK